MYAKNGHAQMDTLFTDTILIEIPFQHMVDSCFEHVDLDLVPTGLLLEHGYPTIDVKAFDGTINDSNYAHTYSWRKAYGTLLRSFIDSTAAFDSLGTLVAAMQVYIDSGFVPISIFNYQYNSIKPSALDDSLFYLTGLQLHDVTGRTQSPYETNTCFMAASAVSATDENTVSFVFKESFYTSNDTRTVDHLEVDFGNGTNHILAWGDTITIVFDSTYTEGISLNLFFTDESSLSSHFTMEANKESPPELSPYNNLPDITNWALAHEGISDQLVVSVRFGCGNSSGAILKPFIVLDGYGDPKLSALSAALNKYHNGRAFWGMFFDKNETAYLNLFKQGYDLVFVSYKDGSAAIQTNAAAVEEMIELINEEKWVYGSTHKNVLLGVSMGGIVGRYALAHMYQQHIANSANPNHDTKLFFSFDSPHWGANAPLGLQAMVVDLYRLYSQGSIPGIEWEEIYWDYKSITSPAAKQMLINHVYWNNRSLHTDFYDELRDVSYNNGQEGNIGCRTIAISNGSGKGLDNGGWYGQWRKPQNLGVAMYPGANMLNFGITKTQDTMCGQCPQIQLETGWCIKATTKREGLHLMG